MANREYSVGDVAEHGKVLPGLSKHRRTCIHIHTYWQFSGSNSTDLHVFGLCGKLKEAGTWTWDIISVSWQCYPLRHCAPCKVVDVVKLLCIPTINGTAGLGLKLFFSIVEFDVPSLEHKVFLFIIFIPALCLVQGFPTLLLENWTTFLQASVPTLLHHTCL